MGKLKWIAVAGLLSLLAACSAKNPASPTEPLAPHSNRLTQQSSGWQYFYEGNTYVSCYFGAINPVTGLPLLTYIKAQKNWGPSNQRNVVAYVTSKWTKNPAVQNPPYTIEVIYRNRQDPMSPWITIHWAQDGNISFFVYTDPLLTRGYGWLQCSYIYSMTASSTLVTTYPI